MNYKIENVLIGSDPEIFIKDSKGELSSAIELFGGTKDKPINIGKGCFVQEDNILVEFNTPPTNSLKKFIDSINYSKDYIETILAPLNKTLHYSSSEIVNEEIIKNPKALEFGCSPSYNVLLESMTDLNLDSFSEYEKLLRSSGFHIHIGYDNPTDDINDRLVLCYELFVTLPLACKDLDNYNRRLLYGKIGDCRDKDYGVECRSLGGYFLANDNLISDVWNNTMKAIEYAKTSNKTNLQLRNLVKSCVNKDNTINHFKVEEIMINEIEKQLI